MTSFRTASPVEECRCVQDLRGVVIAVQEGRISASLCACMMRHRCDDGYVGGGDEPVRVCPVCFGPRRDAERLTRARIPARYRAMRLSTFPINHGSIKAWSAASSVKQGGGCSLWGETMRGKTGLLVAALIAAAEFRPIRYCSWLECVPLYRLRSYTPDREGFERLTSFPGILALDDLSSQGPLPDSALSEIIHRRSDQELQTIAASRLTPALLGESVQSVHRLAPWTEIQGPALV